MSLGVVYPRPLRLVGISGPSASDAAICESWDVLNDWIRRKSLSTEVEIGYVLLQHSALGDGDGVPSYEACIEMSLSVTPSETRKLKRIRLQGGRISCAGTEGWHHACRSRQWWARQD